MIKEKQTDRIFNYNGIKLPDPGAENYPTAEDVKEYYSSAYPEMTNAIIKPEKNKPHVFNITRNTGTKG